MLPNTAPAAEPIQVRTRTRTQPGETWVTFPFGLGYRYEMSSAGRARRIDTQRIYKVSTPALGLPSTTVTIQIPGPPAASFRFRCDDLAALVTGRDQPPGFEARIAEYEARWEAYLAKCADRAQRMENLRQAEIARAEAREAERSAARLAPRPAPRPEPISPRIAPRRALHAEPLPLEPEWSEHRRQAVFLGIWLNQENWQHSAQGWPYTNQYGFNVVVYRAGASQSQDRRHFGCWSFRVCAEQTGLPHIPAPLIVRENHYPSALAAMIAAFLKLTELGMPWVEPTALAEEADWYSDRTPDLM